MPRKSIDDRTAVDSPLFQMTKRFDKAIKLFDTIDRTSSIALTQLCREFNDRSNECKEATTAKERSYYYYCAFAGYDLVIVVAC